MGATHRDAEPADFRFLQQNATVCEQSATILACSPRLKQFATDCNNQSPQRPRRDSQNPVVEHKGSSDGVVVLAL
jgi:hypothetical protein